MIHVDIEVSQECDKTMKREEVPKSLMNEKSVDDSDRDVE